MKVSKDAFQICIAIYKSSFFTIGPDYTVAELCLLYLSGAPPSFSDTDTGDDFFFKFYNYE